MLITFEQLKKIAPHGKDEILNAVIAGLEEYGTLIGLDSPLRLAHFIAQCAHESDSFKTTKEYGGSKARYAPYYGRGIIQTTWEANYNKFNDWLDEHGFEDHPNFKAKSNLDYAAKFPWAFLGAACYWDTHNLNRFSDKDDVLGLTKAINGGTNGLADRKQYLARAKVILGIADTVQVPKVNVDPFKLQQALVNKGFAIEVDGNIGKRTIAAIRLFQKFNGLTVDGIVGTDTKKALGL